MKDPRWTTVDGLFEAALERPPNERAAFLNDVCAGDEALRREVESLLAHKSSDRDFLDAPALELLKDGARAQSLIGRQFGSHRIVSLLGAGGMGEVYRAHDTKLGRDVAIKVLPQVFATDRDRRSRFEREARLLASLNHPHIGGIYGFEDLDGTPALILELVEGDTLAERIAHGPIPTRETLTTARQIADALEAAHDRGIVHRDLKPANVKITRAGVVKVLDFGLAKADASAAVQLDEGDATAPTATMTHTREGIVLGTAGYMSPEQARGKAVDKRTDIWAFGCVLFEMLTGRFAFAGATVPDTIVAVLEREPDWNALRVPAGLRRLLQRCLEKDPNRRLHDIADARIEIDDLLSDPSRSLERTLEVSARQRPGRLWRMVAAFASLAALIAVTALVWFVRTAPRVAITVPRVSRTMLAASGAAALALNGARSLAITPDGRHVVYVGNGGTQLFDRALDQVAPRPIVTGISPLNWVFISPEGQWVGFVEGWVLKKVALVGGPVTTIAVFGAAPMGATWAPDNTIIVATADPATGLLRIPASGGAMTTLTRPSGERGERDHVWPELLPGGRAVLYTIVAATGGLDAAQVAVLDLATGKSTIVVRGGSDARYVSSGYLVYTAGGSLRAVAFDPERLETGGSSIVVPPPVVTSTQGSSELVVATDGTLAYVDRPAAAATVEATLVWVDRKGREEPLPAPPRSYFQPRVSPDGTRVAVAIADENATIWLLNLARRTLSQLRFDRAGDFFPVWMPDGHHLIFATSYGSGLLRESADGAGATEVLLSGVVGSLPSGVTRDGRQLLISNLARDVAVLALDGPPRVQPLIATPFNERNGIVSPDGRWLAYESDSSGQFEIYVRPYPNVNDGQWKISTASGTRPLWAPNGQELFYVGPDGVLMGVRTDARGSLWSASSPLKILEGPYMTLSSISGRTYDISPDGRRFLMVKRPANRAPPQIVIVQNWFEELRRLVPGK
jgi:eukaryotic-like serine/threonine-protein kinase